MNIVHIVHSLRGGGIQNFLISLTIAQSDLGNRVTLIVIDRYDTSYCEHLEKLLIKNGVSVICLNRVVGNKYDSIFTLMKCRRIVQKISPVIVNTHGKMSHIYGSFSTLFSRIKHFITIHNAPEKWTNVQKLCGRNKPLIFCSHAAYDMRTQESINMIAIDNGVSRKIVHSEQVVNLRKEFGLKDNDKVIISVGSLRKQKNYSFLFDIVDCIDDDSFHFFVCGGGDFEEGAIDESLLDSYPTIHYIGLRSDIPAIENSADLFLSCATFEGLPIAVLEAYFNGIPCVLSPIEQHKRISKVSRVWIPDDFTAKSFVKTIRYAIANLDNHTSIYNERHLQIMQYSIEQKAAEYISFYKKCING